MDTYKIPELKFYAYLMKMMAKEIVKNYHASRRFEDKLNGLVDAAINNKDKDEAINKLRDFIQKRKKDKKTSFNRDTISTIDEKSDNYSISPDRKEKLLEMISKYDVSLESQIIDIAKIYKQRVEEIEREKKYSKSNNDDETITIIKEKQPEQTSVNQQKTTEVHKKSDNVTESEELVEYAKKIIDDFSSNMLKPNEDYFVKYTQLYDKYMQNKNHANVYDYSGLGIVIKDQNGVNVPISPEDLRKKAIGLLFKSFQETYSPYGYSYEQSLNRPQSYSNLVSFLKNRLSYMTIKEMIEFMNSTIYKFDNSLYRKKDDVLNHDGFKEIIISEIAKRIYTSRNKGKDFDQHELDKITQLVREEVKEDDFSKIDSNAQIEFKQVDEDRIIQLYGQRKHEESKGILEKLRQKKNELLNGRGY